MKLKKILGLTALAAIATFALAALQNHLAKMVKQPLKWVS